MRTIKRVNTTKGFTFIEILIVLAIIAIVSVVAVLSLHILDNGRGVKILAHQLMQAIQAGEQEAVLRPAVLGLRFTEHGYRFYRLKNKNGTLYWGHLKPDVLSKPKAFHDGIFASVIDLRDQKVDDIDNRMSFIEFYPDATISPTVIEIANLKRDRIFKLSIKHNGNMILREQTQ